MFSYLFSGLNEWMVRSLYIRLILTSLCQSSRSATMRKILRCILFVNSNTVYIRHCFCLHWHCRHYFLFYMPLPTLVRWNQPCFGQKRLQDIKAEEFKRFTDDKRLLMANDMIDVAMGRFVKVLDLKHCLYVYKHPKH